MPEQVEREVEVPAPPDEVWPALTDPERLGDWFDADVDLEVRPGGAGSFRFADGEVRRAMVREVDENERLSFVWWPLSPAGVGPTTTVTITLEPTGTGSRVRLVESTMARAKAVA
jgi:uncharacterized protein YndB with AHSA1/START domain